MILPWSLGYPNFRTNLHVAFGHNYDSLSSRVAWACWMLAERKWRGNSQVSCLHWVCLGLSGSAENGLGYTPKKHWSILIFQYVPFSAMKCQANMSQIGPGEAFGAWSLSLWPSKQGEEVFLESCFQFSSTWSYTYLYLYLYIYMWYISIYTYIHISIDCINTH